MPQGMRVQLPLRSDLLFLFSMGKSNLSWFLLICGAVVAYLYVTNYIDSITQENFTTPAVTQINKTAREVGAKPTEYQIGVQGLSGQVE